MIDEVNKEVTEPIAGEVNAETVNPVAEEVAATDVPAVDAIPAPTSRDKFNSRIASAYPDEKFEGDDAVYGKANERLDSLEEFQNKGMEVNKMLATVLQGEPELDGIVKAVIKGMPTRAAIAKYFSPEDLIPTDGEPDEAQYKTSSTERSQRVSDKAKFEQEVDDNLKASEVTLKEFAAENNLDETQAGELIDIVSELMSGLYKGQLPKDLLSHVHKSKTSAKQIEDAAADGELKGKNAKIEAVMAGEKKAGDKIPVFSGGKTEDTTGEPPVKKSRLDLLVERENAKRKF